MGYLRTKTIQKINRYILKDSKIVILVYDITYRQSFKGLFFWINKVEEILGKNNIKYGIMGNKNDLKNYQQVLDEESYEFDNLKGIKLRLVSAKSNPREIYNFIKELSIDYISKYLTINTKKINLNKKQKDKIKKSINKKEEEIKKKKK